MPWTTKISLHENLTHEILWCTMYMCMYVYVPYMTLKFCASEVIVIRMCSSCTVNYRRLRNFVLKNFCQQLFGTERIGAYAKFPILFLLSEISVRMSRPVTWTHVISNSSGYRLTSKRIKYGQYQHRYSCQIECKFIIDDSCPLKTVAWAYINGSQCMIIHSFIRFWFDIHLELKCPILSLSLDNWLVINWLTHR